ncbi:MAG TPA: DMT family transporter [Thermoplasmata archaeon]|nr:DMT family transporter [Thermoplasmata archaeon]
MSSRRKDYGMVLVASVLWGTSFPAIKVAVGGAGDVDPFLLTFLRLGLAAAAGVVLLVALRRLSPAIFRNRYVWILGALNAVGYDLQHMAEVYTTASKTSLLVNVNVLFVALFMIVLFKERMTAGKGLGVLLGLAGVAVLATRLDPSFLSQGEFEGDLMALGTGFVWAVYTIHTKRMVDRGGDYLALTVGVLATTTLFSAIALPWANLSRPIPAAGWAGILWLGLVTTLPPLVLWTWSMVRISPTISAVLLLNEVAVASVLSILFLGEPFAGYFLLGGALILAGWLAVSLGDRARASDPHPPSA